MEVACDQLSADLRPLSRLQGQNPGVWQLLPVDSGPSGVPFQLSLLSEPLSVGDPQGLSGHILWPHSNPALEPPATGRHRRAPWPLSWLSAALSRVPCLLRAGWVVASPLVLSRSPAGHHLRPCIEGAGAGEQRTQADMRQRGRWGRKGRVGVWGAWPRAGGGQEPPSWSAPRLCAGSTAWQGGPGGARPGSLPKPRTRTRKAGARRPITQPLAGSGHEWAWGGGSSRSG